VRLCFTSCRFRFAPFSPPFLLSCSSRSWFASFWFFFVPSAVLGAQARRSSQIRADPRRSAHGCVSASVHLGSFCFFLFEMCSLSKLIFLCFSSGLAAYRFIFSVFAGRALGGITASAGRCFDWTAAGLISWWCTLFCLKVIVEHPCCIQILVFPH
jgi:hypothetical protein